MKPGFLEKLVARLDRLEPADVQQLVSRLNRERDFLKKVFLALREGVILLDPAGKIDFVNPAACQFFGLDAERAIGEPLGAQIRGLDWDTLGKPGRTINRDLEVYYPENRYLNFYLAPIDGNDVLQGYVMLVRDLTSTREEAEKTLESERMNALTLLAAGVAHEIGNPLNSLDIHLQLLGRKLRKLPPGDRKPLEENLGTARQEIQRLDTILKQFLHAVRPTTPRRERQDLHLLLQDTMRLLEPELTSRKISVELDLAANMPPAQVDPGQFQQVFYNLIRNAYQALPGETGRIVIHTKLTDYEYVIIIQDNGSGISPEHMGALFEPYKTTKSGGTGLGLLIVRRIIREHGGSIEIDSDADGTRVLIHLPRGERAVRLLGSPDSVIDLRISMQPTLLIVDDERATRDGLRSALEEEFDVYTAAGNAEALAILKSEPIQLLLTDLRMGADSGMDLLEAALAMPEPPVAIMMTAYGSVDTAVEAMRRGAWHFVTKPPESGRGGDAAEASARNRTLEVENQQLTQQVQKNSKLDRLIGKSPAINQVAEMIQQVAPTRATVLIEGESGTGKEVVAHTLHHLSGRPAAKLVIVHCAALSAQLLESELFGHEKGAFTGAAQRRIGRFEQADGGSIFLDEIGEIDSATQVKLLRVLSERSIERVGSNSPIKVDVRVIAATNKNLKEMVEKGTFREDLYFRLNVVKIEMPPLRTRKEDIVLLANSFLHEFAKENDRPSKPLTDAALQLLISYSWPGNVRELRTAIEHGVVMSNDPVIDVRHLPQFLFSSSSTQSPSVPVTKNSLAGPADFNLHALETNTIRAALATAEGNRTHAAELLGLSRRTLQRKLKELGL